MSENTKIRVNGSITSTRVISADVVEAGLSCDHAVRLVAPL